MGSEWVCATQLQMFGLVSPNIFCSESLGNISVALTAVEKKSGTEGINLGEKWE